jgi:hypothetical protein
MPQTADKVRLSPEEALKSPQPHHVGFEYGEHFWLGDSLAFTLADGTVKFGKDLPFTLSNGVVMTYGQINGLAGDFYATEYPISYGSIPQEQQARFRDAFNTLATGYADTPAEVKTILDLMQTEVDAINAAIKAGVDPSTIYPNLPNIDVALQQATMWRWSNRTGMPTYLGVSQLNMDHFGEDARTAYLAGHTVACQKAASGTSSDTLMAAYSMNAFADHFLEDSFSAGHMRTPRRYCHTGGTSGDRCAKVRHNCGFVLLIATPLLTGISHTVHAR